MNISKTWVWYINHYKACVPATKIIAYNWKYSQSLWMLYILWIFFSSIHHCQKIGCIINNVLSLVNGYFYWWQLFAPLILYLQSSKATLEDIVIIRHGRTRNMYNNKTAAMTLAYIVEWQLFTLENEWSIFIFITILNYIFMIYHEYSWGEWWHTAPLIPLFIR